MMRNSVLGHPSLETYTSSVADVKASAGLGHPGAPETLGEHAQKGPVAKAERTEPALSRQVSMKSAKKHFCHFLSVVANFTTMGGHLWGRGYWWKVYLLRLMKVQHPQPRTRQAENFSM